MGINEEFRNLWLDSSEISEYWGVNSAYVRTSIKQSPKKWPDGSFRYENHKYYVLYDQVERLLGFPKKPYLPNDGSTIISPYREVRLEFSIETVTGQNLKVLGVISKYATLANTSFSSVKLSSKYKPYTLNDYHYSGVFILKETDVYQFIAEMDELKSYTSHYLTGSFFNENSAESSYGFLSNNTMRYDFMPNFDRNYAINNMKVGSEVGIVRRQKDGDGYVKFHRIQDIDYDRQRILIKRLMGLSSEWVSFYRLVNYFDNDTESEQLLKNADLFNNSNVIMNRYHFVLHYDNEIIVDTIIQKIYETSTLHDLQSQLLIWLPVSSDTEDIINKLRKAKTLVELIQILESDSRFNLSVGQL